MTRILFLIRSLDIGGTERQLVTLAAGLHRLGHSVKIAVFVSGGALESELRSKGVPIMDLGRKNRWDLISVYLKLYALILEEQPQVLYSYLQVSNIWAGLIRPWFPQLKILWGMRTSGAGLHSDGLWAFLSYRLETLLSRWADLIICNSHAGERSAIERGLPQEKLLVVPNGIDMQSFHQALELGGPLRVEWGIGEDELLIGLVGRLDRLKDHTTFIESAALLSAENSRVRFVCVGGGDPLYTSELQRKAAQLKVEHRLVWAAERRDMLAVYNALDLLVLSSYAEGFPNVVAEAMVCGVPCVVTDVGDAARIVGEEGVVVPPSNPRALREGMQAMLARMAQDEPGLNKRVHQRIMENFSVEQLVQRTVALLGKQTGEDVFLDHLLISSIKMKRSLF